MKKVLRELAEHYSGALREYCEKGEESALLRAYQLGRGAVQAGLGVLEISALHQEVLVGTLVERLAPDDHARLAHRACAFFAECLAPFELTRRGFEDAHATLCNLNEGLEQRLEAALHAIEAAQKQILQQKKVSQAKNDVIGVVSHELRTPLTSIHGSIHLLKSGLGGELNARGQRLLDVAYRNSQRLVRLVNDVLDLQRLESGTMTFNMRPAALRPLLDHAVEANQAFAAQFGVTLLLKPGLPGARVRVDTDQLMQVMANLLSNAAKFSPPDDTVVIETERRGPLLRVAVTDHGLGVPEEFRHRIFQKFAQAEVSADRKGSGLGLSITKAILDHMGGDIGFEIGAGRTTFYFDLPEWKSRATSGQAVGEDTCAVGR